MLLDVGPGFGRQVHVLADLPVADHGAQLLGRAVDERLLFFGQLGLGVGQQGIPVGAATEQLAVPPDGAGIDGIALGLGHRRQNLLEPAEQRRTEILAPQIGQQQRGGDRCQQHPENQQQPAGGTAKGAHGQEVDGDHAQGGQGGGTAMGQVGHCEHQNQYPQQQHIQSSVKPGVKSPSERSRPSTARVSRAVRVQCKSVSCGPGPVDRGGHDLWPIRRYHWGGRLDRLRLPLGGHAHARVPASQPLHR